MTTDYIAIAMIIGWIAFNVLKVIKEDITRNWLPKRHEILLFKNDNINIKKTEFILKFPRRVE
jgi:hypothetical protein